MSSIDDIVIATFNAEKNGFGDAAIRQAVYDMAIGHGVQLLFRQELVDGDLDQHAIRYEAERAMCMRSWFNPQGGTAVFVDTEVFEPIGEWHKDWSKFRLQPTAVTLQLREAGPHSTPLIAVAAHLSYLSSAQRELETGDLTYFNDKHVEVSGHRQKAIPIMGMDGNSYPHQILPGECPLPELAHIADEPHRAHRSRRAPDGTLVMDQEPHRILHTAGIHDIATHVAGRSHELSAVNPTVFACDTHGPDARVDWLLAGKSLLPAFHKVQVINGEPMSDHNLVIAWADRARLAELLTLPTALRVAA